jgi:hypothetical protein
MKQRIVAWTGMLAVISSIHKETALFIIVVNSLLLFFDVVNGGDIETVPSLPNGTAIVLNRCNHNKCCKCNAN